MLIFTAPVQSQNQQKADSLKQLLNERLPDSTRIKIYGELCWDYATTRSKLDTAELYADSIRLFSEKRDIPWGTASAHFYYGVIGRFNARYYEALKHLEEYVNFYQQEGDSVKLSAGLFQMGAINWQLGNDVESLTCYHRILNIYRNNDMQNSVGSTLHLIGHIQRKLNKHEQAIESYKESIAIKEQFNDITGLSMSTESLGNTYGELKQYDQAEHYLLKALDIVKGEERPYGIASVTENLGNLVYEMGNYQKALNYQLESLYIREGLPSNKNLSVSLFKVGNTYAKLGKIDPAKKYLSKSLAIAKEIKVPPLIMENYKALMELNESAKKITEAFEYQELYMTVKDSIFNAEKNQQLVELETKYETAQKDQEIALLTKENEVHQAKVERQATLRNALIGGVISLLLIAGLIFYTMRQRLKSQKLITAKNEQIKVSYLKEELKTLEMKALRAQMNPHFLFNSLNSINTMIIKDEKDDASRYLTKFSKLVRLMLENSEESKVTLKDELDMLVTYIQLESSRFENKMDYEIKVASSIDTESTYLPSMVLQPFVENAIWHGLLHNEDKGKLTIDIKEENDYLQCSIIDNGIGREESLKVQKQSGYKKKSMGIKITADRLKLLTKQTVKELIDIIDLKDPENNALGTQVNVLIPIS